jgi:hypothetical protein
LNPESSPSLASQESALQPLLIFRYRWTSAKKTQLGVSWNF